MLPYKRHNIYHFGLEYPWYLWEKNTFILSKSVKQKYFI